jgi:hypothetical protein
LVVLLLATAIVFAVVYIAYRWVDPLPPRHFAIAAGPPGAGYDEFARQYARILARYGVELEIRNSAGGVENFDLLRDPTSRVQAAITGFGFAHSNDADTLYSLGAIFDAPIFIFYKDAEPITLFAQFRGKRVSIGKPGTSQQYLMLEVLRVTDALNDSIKFLDFDFNESVEALLAEQIDVAAVPQIDLREPVRRALNGPGIRLMSVAQAEAIAKIIPGLKHVVLSRGLISLSGDIPNVDIDLLALRNRVLVRNDLHPALQYLLLEAMREVHRPPGPFNRLGEFPAEQPNDLSLSPTAQAFYRSGPTFWQRYTSFWLASLLNRIVFFVIPVVLVFVPLIGLAPQIYRWVYVHRIHELHRALGKFERELARSTESSHFLEHQERIAEIASAVQSLKVPRAFEVDLQRLRIHLRMVQEDLSRMAAANKVEL